MMELLSYDFITRALIAGTIVAITAAVVGNFVVAARQAFISDMLAHAALAGVGVGMFLHVSPSLLAGVVAVVASVFLWVLTHRAQRAPEAVSMLLLTGGLAIALLFSHAAKDNPVSFETFLFGSILTVTEGEIYFFGGVCAVVVILFLVYWRSFLVSVFDPQFARVQSRWAPLHEISLLVSVSVLVAVALKVIGGLLVGALLVIPVMTAQHVSQSFRSNVVWSAFFGVVGIFLGIASSFYADVPASSGIVLSLIMLFAITFVYDRIRMM